MILPLPGGFDALPSFDRINLASTLLQTAVILAFAAAQTGAARHFDRPAMRSMAVVWQLFAVSALINIFSSVAGAVWNERTLSREFTSLVVALLAAAVPYVRSAVRELASTALTDVEPHERSVDVASTAAQTRAASIQWGLVVLLVHVGGVLGSAALWPDLRVVTVSISRAVQLSVLVMGAATVWNALRATRQNRAALELLAVGLTAFAFRQAVAVVLGFRVGMPDLPFVMVVCVVVLDIVAVMVAGACTLLATTAEEVGLVNSQAQQLARVQSDLATAKRMESLGRMAAGVAHDINNMLQVIGMATEVVGDRASTPAEQGAMKQLESAMTHARSLNTQLLTFAKAQPTKPVQFDPAQRLHGISALLTAMAGARLTISITPSVDGVSLRMDPAQFEQLVINLVANARDAVKADGDIRVQLDRVSVSAETDRALSLQPGDYLRLVVADSGHGIPLELQSQIFEPFFTTKPAGRGSGLGLATVHGIARQASGRVTLESQVGQGTTFEVLLPAA